MENDLMTEILGYSPGPDQRRDLIQQSVDSGQTLGEVCRKYAMPELFLLDDNGLLDYTHPDGTIEKMTPQQFEALHPYRKIVTLKS